jgi:hypothetical protein
MSECSLAVRDRELGQVCPALYCCPLLKYRVLDGVWKTFALNCAMEHLLRCVRPDVNRFTYFRTLTIIEAERLLGSMEQSMISEAPSNESHRSTK